MESKQKIEFTTSTKIQKRPQLIVNDKFHIVHSPTKFK